MNDPSPSEAPAVFSASLPQSQTKAPNSGGKGNGSVAIYVVLAAVIAMIVAFVVRKTKRRRQQKMFEETWRVAEKEIVNSHRNLNYRDHASTAKTTNPVSFSPYRDGNGFHDEEQPREVMDFDEQEELHRNTFVLDTNMLDKMN